MCFGGGGNTAAVTPAPAPEAPSPVAIQQDIGAARKQDDLASYGTSTPSLRRDDSAISGGIVAGGTGLKMP